MVDQIEELAPREAMAFDVVIVGAGPAGLATAIRLKQRAAEAGGDVSVVVVEKGSEVGAHILSGAVIDPIGLDRLLPDWRDDPDRPLKTEVTKDEFLFLRKAGGAAATHDHVAEADGQPRQLRGLTRQPLPLSGPKGRGAGRRDLPGLPSCGSSDRQQG